MAAIVQIVHADGKLVMVRPLVYMITGLQSDLVADLAVGVLAAIVDVFAGKRLD